MCFTVGYDSMGGVKFFFFLTALGNDFESKRDYSYLAGLSPLLFMLNPSLYSLLSYSEWQSEHRQREVSINTNDNCELTAYTANPLLYQQTQLILYTWNSPIAVWG